METGNVFFSVITSPWFPPRPVSTGGYGVGWGGGEGRGVQRGVHFGVAEVPDVFFVSVLCGSCEKWEGKTDWCRAVIRCVVRLGRERWWWRCVGWECSGWEGGGGEGAERESVCQCV